MKNLKQMLLIALLLQFSVITYASDEFTHVNYECMNVINYQDGTYETLEDFNNSNVSTTDKLIVSTQDNVAYRFIDTNSKKIKKPAVIVNNGEVYFNITTIVKNFDKESRGQGYDGGKYYIKAENINNQLVMKDFFASNLSGFAGGMIGAAAARREKVIIYKPESREFRLFKNLDKFEEYVEKNYPSKVHLLRSIPENNDTATEAGKVMFVLKNLES